jgi:hypothetical protein
MLADDGGAVAVGDDDDDDDDENENGDDNDDCAAGIEAGEDKDDEDAVSVAASTDDTIATPAADPFSRATNALHRARVTVHSRSASLRLSRSVRLVCRWQRTTGTDVQIGVVVECTIIFHIRIFLANM